MFISARLEAPSECDVRKTARPTARLLLLLRPDLHNELTGGVGRPAPLRVITPILHPARMRQDVNSGRQNNNSNKSVLSGLIALGKRAS